MWGHAAICGCPLCKVLHRVFYLIVLGQAHPSFGGYATGLLRNGEAELRDELQRLGPPPVTSPAPAAAPPAAGESREGEQASQGPPGSTPKGAPPQPPTQLSGPEGQAPATEKKKEIKEEVATKASEGVEEVTEPKPKERASSSGIKRRDRSHERKRGENRSPSSKRDRRGEKRSRDRDRKRKRSESRRRSREAGGREKKARSEKPPEPVGPPPDRRAYNYWYPRDQEYHHYQHRQGPGWRGELPRSDHARWSQSQNKGQVKRAKQEIFNRKRHSRR